MGGGNGGYGGNGGGDAFSRPMSSQTRGGGRGGMMSSRGAPPSMRGTRGGGRGRGGGPGPGPGPAYSEGPYYAPPPIPRNGQYQQQPQYPPPPSPHQQYPVDTTEASAYFEPGFGATPPSAQPDTRQLQDKVRELEASVQELTKQQEYSKTFYGLVEGGTDEYVKLYSNAPTSAQPQQTVKPVGRASKGRWLRLSYPRIVLEIPSEHGGTRTDIWLCVHAIDGETGEVKRLWVQNAPQSFSSFSMFPVFNKD